MQLNKNKLLLASILSLFLISAAAGNTYIDNNKVQTDNLDVQNKMLDSVFYDSNKITGAKNLEFGTDLERPLTTESDKDVSVCSSGCDYSSLQAALNDVPYFLNHHYHINLNSGTYNENVTIPDFYASSKGQTHNQEGNKLMIEGDTSNPADYNISSIYAEGAYGTIPLQINGVNILNDNPYDNENVGIGLYGVSQAELNKVSFVGSDATSGILCYHSECKLAGVNFGNNDLNDFGVKVKHSGWATENDFKYGYGSKGSVGDNVYDVQDGKIFFLGSSSTATSGNALVQTGHGFAVDVDNGKFYNFDQTSGQFDVSGDLNMNKNPVRGVNAIYKDKENDWFRFYTDGLGNNNRISIYDRNKSQRIVSWAEGGDMFLDNANLEAQDNNLKDVNSIDGNGDAVTFNDQVSFDDGHKIQINDGGFPRLYVDAQVGSSDIEAANGNSLNLRTTNSGGGSTVSDRISISGGSDQETVNIKNSDLNLNSNKVQSSELYNLDSTTLPTCDSSTEGDIRYDGSKHYGCDGSSWSAMY